MLAPNDLHLALLNPWQRDFPLVRAPFAHIAHALRTASGPQPALAMDEAAVIRHYRALADQGALSRIGGVFGVGAGGAGLLAAMAVPAERLEAVAAVVDAHPAVNHNYEREHRYNLWFVVNGPNAGAVEYAVQALEARTGLAALRLPMQRAYRIDLGFDLRHRVATHTALAVQPAAAAVHPDDQPLAALVEAGLPIEAQPYDRWAREIGRQADSVLDTLRHWLAQGTLRRFGVVVRHHELGFGANAMTVFNVPDEQVDEVGSALAATPGVTLAYRRARAEGWPYNLYCMVHGRDRESVHEVLAEARPRCGLGQADGAVLFSRRRFKQEGARRFRALRVGDPIAVPIESGGNLAGPQAQEVHHAA